MLKKLKVSILIPIRNEEANLNRLFESLDNLNYPKSQLEIMLGNDDSEDQSAQMIESYAKGKEWVKVLHLDDSFPLKGKTRVLNQLAKSASGDFLFFTDADVALPADWISGMLEEFEENTGVVIGVTGFENTPLWSAVQGIEWLMALSIFKLAADMKVPSTGLGNNMAVSKKAYDSIGGYEKIGFSIVEDFHLYNEIIKAGFGFKHAFKPEVLANTLPPEKYLKQRKRWIKGAMSARPWAMIPAILQALFLPILIFIASNSIWLTLTIFIGVFLIYAILILFFENRLRIRGYFKYLIPFGIYISVAWLVQFIYFFLKKDTVWKGRNY